MKIFLITHSCIPTSFGIDHRIEILWADETGNRHMTTGRGANWIDAMKQATYWLERDSKTIALGEQIQ